MNPCPFLLCLYLVAHNVVRCKETDGQVIRPVFVDGGQEWSSTVCHILKNSLTFFRLRPFPVTPIQKVCSDAPGSNIPIPFADNLPDRAGEVVYFFTSGRRFTSLGMRLINSHYVGRQTDPLGNANSLGY